jgi:hypothetical protein
MGLDFYEEAPVKRMVPVPQKNGTLGSVLKIYVYIQVLIRILVLEIRPSYLSNPVFNRQLTAG